MFKMTKLRENMDFNKLMRRILDALKGVASAEYSRLQAERREFANLEGLLKDFFESVKLGGVKHPFFDVSPGPKNIILITSDASFLGKLNMSVVKPGLEQYKKGDILTVVGRQGVRYLEEFGEEFTTFAGIDDNISYQGVTKLRDHIIETFLKKKLSGVTIIYPHFVSFAVQTIQQLQVFPCKFLFAHGEGSEAEEIGNRESLLGGFEQEVIIEPSGKSVAEYLIRVWLTQSIHLIFWESKLSEWAARVVHLEKSVNETKKQDKILRLKYFRLLHQISDQNIREIFCNRLVLRK